MFTFIQNKKDRNEGNHLNDILRREPLGELTGGVPFNRKERRAMAKLRRRKERKNGKRL